MCSLSMQESIVCSRSRKKTVRGNAKADALHCAKTSFPLSLPTKRYLILPVRYDFIAREIPPFSDQPPSKGSFLAHYFKASKTAKPIKNSVLPIELVVDESQAKPGLLSRHLSFSSFISQLCARSRTTN